MLTRKPRVGDCIQVFGETKDADGSSFWEDCGNVDRVGGSLCYVVRGEKDQTRIFIWRCAGGQLNKWFRIKEGNKSCVF